MNRSTMDALLAEHRARLNGLAHRMLGSSADADDALQDVWLRIRAVDPATIDNPGGWLTTVTARVCLNVLRNRTTRRDDSIDALDGVATDDDPAHDAVLADAVGLALLVVLDSLSPAERVAFVLHDMFAMPFEEIAPIVDRSVATTRQLASRARRRVQPGAGDEIVATVDLDGGRRRQLVDAFFAAARRGDLAALIEVLHPDVALTSNRGSTTELRVHGAPAVATRATMFANPTATLAPIAVDDHAGVSVDVDERRIALMLFTIVNDVIVAIETITDSERLAVVRVRA